MPADEVTAAQLCGKCGSQVSTFSVKKDNLMLTSTDQIWCSHCQEDTPEVRDVAGRLESIKRAVESYPKAVPATPPQSSPDGRAT